MGDQSLLRILDSGRVGIGTVTPLDDLHVNDGDAALRLTSSAAGTWGSTINLSETINGLVANNWAIRRTTSTSGDGGSLRFRYDPDGDDNHTTHMTILPTGEVGLGTVTPEMRLHVVDAIAPMLVEKTGSGGFAAAEIDADQGIGLYATANNSAAILARGVNNGITAEAGGNATSLPLLVRATGAEPVNIAVFATDLTGNEARIDRTGRGYFNGGTQTGGADVAEAFEVEGFVSDYEPGDVLVISTERDRTVAISVEPYSTLVAGVHATKPGVLLSERHIDACHDDTVPMGVVGVVPTKVSGENGPIRRGDLLVTSSIPGHAMKGTDRGRMIGAIIGKALEEFDGSGTGVIRVMVNVK